MIKSPFNNNFLRATTTSLSLNTGVPLGTTQEGYFRIVSGMLPGCYALMTTDGKYVSFKPDLATLELSPNNREWESIQILEGDASGTYQIQTCYWNTKLTASSSNVLGQSQNPPSSDINFQLFPVVALKNIDGRYLSSWKDTTGFTTVAAVNTWEYYVLLPGTKTNLVYILNAHNRYVSISSTTYSVSQSSNPQDLSKSPLDRSIVPTDPRVYIDSANPDTYSTLKDRNDFFYKVGVKPDSSAVDLSTNSDSLIFSLYAQTPSSTGQKIFTDIIGRKFQDSKPEAGAPVFGSSRTVTFNMKLDNNFENPSSGKRIIVLQWWQGANLSPPFQVHINPDLTWGVVVRDDNGRNDAGTATFVGDTLSRGVWHSFSVTVTPRWDTPGSFSVTRTGGVTVSNSAYKIGYQPFSITAADPYDFFTISFGLYRTFDSKNAIAYFKNVNLNNPSGNWPN